MLNSTNGTQHGAHCEGTDNDVDAWWILGICISLGASLFNTCALVLQKYAHIENEKLPEDQRFKEFAPSMLCHPVWLMGWLMIVLGGIPTDIVAAALVPSSVLSPLSGFTIVMTQVVSPFMLGEHVTWKDIFASWVILLGCALTSIFGDHCSAQYTLDELGDYATRPYFIMAEMLVPIIYLGGGILVYRWWDHREYVGATFMVMAGLTGSQQVLLFKALGEQLELVFNGDTRVFEMWQFYVLVPTVIVVAIGQLSLMNNGLKRWDAVKALPLYNVCLITFGASFGGIFYEDYKTLTVLGYIMWPVGVVVILAGISCLVREPERAESTPLGEKAESDADCLHTEPGCFGYEEEEQDDEVPIEVSSVSPHASDYGSKLHQADVQMTDLSSVNRGQGGNVDKTAEALTPQNTDPDEPETPFT